MKNKANMFCQLCMIYISFLATFTTIVVGLPAGPLLVRVPRLPRGIPQGVPLGGAPLGGVLPETKELALRNATIHKRDTYPQCNDPVYNEYAESWCSTLTQISVMCNQRDNPPPKGRFMIYYIDCRPKELCVDVHYNDPKTGEEVSDAMCFGRENYVDWTTDRDPDESCSQSFRFHAAHQEVAIGMTVYNMDGKPIDVYDLYGYRGHDELTHSQQRHNYSRSLQDYGKDEALYLCVRTESYDTVHAVGVGVVVRN